MKYIVILYLFLTSTSFAAESTGFFEGTLNFSPVGCQQNKSCTVSYDLWYTDPSSIVWKADANNITNGASIPGWAQSIIGDPFDEKFVKPAVIHDHYCDEKHRVRSWIDTHYMFYQGLKNQGVDELKAKLMYLAVLIGGPKWRVEITGRDCGHNCVNAQKIKTTIKRSTINDKSRNIEFEKIQSILNEKKGNLTISEINELVKKEFPQDDFYSKPSLIDRTTASAANSQ